MPDARTVVHCAAALKGAISTRTTAATMLCRIMTSFALSRSRTFSEYYSGQEDTCLGAPELDHSTSPLHVRNIWPCRRRSGSEPKSDVAGSRPEISC